MGETTNILGNFSASNHVCFFLNGDLSISHRLPLWWHAFTKQEDGGSRNLRESSSNDDVFSHAFINALQLSKNMFYQIT